jgi:hypothetical protein
VAMTSSWSRTMSALGWAKTVRIAAATISAEPLGIRARTLRTQWTRQRWTAAPGEDGLRGAAQAGVGVGDDQLHPREAAGPE